MSSYSLLQRLLQLIWFCCSLAYAQNSSSSIALPGINFDSIGGDIAVLGHFDGLSFYDTDGASSFLAMAEANSSSLYVRNTTSGSSSVIATVAGGSISQLSQLSDDTVLVFGSFTSVNDDDISPPFILNVTSGDTSALFTQSSKRDNSISGSVLTTFVDGDLVYLGGDFEFNNTYGAAVYNSTSKEMYSLPFKGFGENSSVNAITKYPSDDLDASIIFGGSFNTLGLPELLLHNISSTSSSSNSSNSTNTTLISAEQVISLKHATFSSVNGISSNDNSEVICPTNDYTWALESSSGGQWAAELPLEMRGITPTKVRIYVPANSSNGIKDFRIYTYPNNGIMNLTYVDPSTNALAYCDASCPLQLASTLSEALTSNIDDAEAYEDDDSVFIDENGSFTMYYDSSTKSKNLGYGRDYQEFALVNDIEINKIGLTTISWYGSRAEFSAFELYSNSITVYGNETLNEPNCASESSEDMNSASIDDGTWQSVLSLTDSLTDDNYLVSVVDETSSITLYPNISYSGYYSILFYTPGCSADGSCSKRSRVNVTVTDVYGDIVSDSVIYQNNLDDKFDYLFYGHLNGSSTVDGQTKVKIEYISAIESSVSDPWVVVDKVVANIVSLDNYSMSNSSNSTDSHNSTKSYITTMSLNGLFEFSLANFSSFDENLVYEEIDNRTIIKKTNTFVGNSSINVLSGNLSDSSTISQMVYSSDSKKLLLNGDFASSNITLSNNELLTLSVEGYNTTANDTEVSSIAKRLNKREESTILNITFNDTITKLQSIDGGIVLLGAFSASGDSISNLADSNDTTSTANNFLLYSNNQWYSFGNSYYDQDFSSFTSIELDGIEYFVFATESGTYLTWDNTNQIWSSSNDKLDITSAVNLEERDQQVIGGSSFGIMDYYENDQGYFKNNNGFDSMGLNITSGSITTSYYLNSSYCIVGGKFTANDSITNLALIHNFVGSPLQDQPEMADDVFVTTIYIDKDDGTLFIGTNGSATVANSNVTGLLVYNLNNESFSTVQPPDLSKSDGSSIAVNALALYDESSRLLVGGNFDNAGSLSCQSVCIYDIENTRWINPVSSSSSSISGEVTDAKFIGSDTVLISGNLTFNESSTSFVIYDFSQGEFTSAGSGINDTGVSGIISKYTMNDKSDGSLNKRMSALGTNFVIGYDGNSWSRLDNEIEYSTETELTDLRLVQLTSKNSNNQNQTYFDSDKALLLSGLFNLTDYGTLNVALYDGAKWIPYIFSSYNSSMGLVYSLLLEEIYKSQSSSDIKTSSTGMSAGQIVGVSLACAIGSTALLGLLYVIPLLFLMRESKKEEKVNQRIYEDEMMNAVNPEDLLHEMDAQRRY